MEDCNFFIERFDIYSTDFFSLLFRRQKPRSFVRNTGITIQYGNEWDHMIYYVQLLCARCHSASKMGQFS
jgi:hypothetical protein